MVPACRLDGTAVRLANQETWVEENMRPIHGLFIVALASMVPVTSAYAIDKNGGGRQGINNPGTAADPYPFVPVIWVDNDGDGDFTDAGTGKCTGTLVAPKVVVTAGHCFDQIAGADKSIPADRVRVDFGNLPGPNDAIDNTGGAQHPNYPPAPTLDTRSPPFGNDVAYIELATAPETTPVPLYRPQAQVGDTNVQVGYGGNHAVLKAQGETTIDALHPGGGHIVSTINAGETFIEGGDSGGPGLIANSKGALRQKTLPEDAYLPGWDKRGRDVFVVSAVHSGPPTSGTLGKTDDASILDQRGAAEDNLRFLKSALPLPNEITIRHNLEVDPFSLPDDAVIGMLISAGYEDGRDYLFNPVLWEEDTDNAFFDARDMALGPVENHDDLVGYGFAAGTLPTGASLVHAWDFTSAHALKKILDPTTAFDADEPLDWFLEMPLDLGLEDAGFGPVFDLFFDIDDLLVDIMTVSLFDLQADIQNAENHIFAGDAIRGAFALFEVSEPPAWTVFLAAMLSLLALTRRLRPAA